MPSANTRHRAFGPGIDPKFDPKSKKKGIGHCVWGGLGPPWGAPWGHFGSYMAPHGPRSRKRVDC